MLLYISRLPQSIFELLPGKVNSLLLLSPADSASHSEKEVALFHPKIIQFDGYPNRSADIPDSIICPFEIWSSLFLSSHVIANHIIVCGSRVVFLHVREGLPCVLIGVPAYL